MQKLKQKRGAMLAGVIGLTLVVAALSYFVLSRQNQNARFVLEEVVDTNQRRKLSDLGMKLSMNLRDNRDNYVGPYDCSPDPSWISVATVGMGVENSNIFFKCLMPTPLGEYYIKIEDRGARTANVKSTISIQGSKCKKAILSFDASAAPALGYVSLDYNPATSDPSDHVWSGGTFAGVPVSCNVPGKTCYNWAGASVIKLTSYCATSFSTAMLAQANITKINSTFANMSSLQWIDLNSNKIASVNENLFKGLNQLKRLNFSGNLLTTLPEKLFFTQTSLENLDLRYNKLLSLEPLQFQNTLALKYLYLTDNSFGKNLSNEVIPPTVFSSLVNLEELYLDGWYTKVLIEKLAPNLFEGLTNLKYLGLGSLRLKSLDPDLFKDLVNLVNLNLSDNLLSGTLPETVFQPLVSLKDFNIRYNLLTGLHPNQFFKNTELLNMYFLDNPFAPNDAGPSDAIPDNVFREQKKLKALEMSGHYTKGKIEKFWPNTFAGLDELIYLDLRNLSLKTLPTGTFNGLDKLETLYLDGNFLSGALVANLFQPLVELKNLSFRWNLLTSLEMSQFSTNNKLVSLVMTDNPFGPNNTLVNVGENIPVGVFSPLVNLEYLGLDRHYSKGNIEKLWPNTFAGLIKLKNLNLHNQNLKSFEASVLNGLVALATIGLAYNSFLPATIAPNSFANLTKLESINLTGNSLAASDLNGLLTELLVMKQTYNTLKDFNASTQVPPIVPDPGKVQSLKDAGVIVTLL